MTIYQAYTSIPILKFNFKKLFGLEEYRHKDKPLVVFGMYRKEDVSIVRRHRGPVVIVWTGNDTTKHKLGKVKSKNIIHATWLPKVKEYLKEHGGIDSLLLKLPAREKPKPMPAGSKVYAYLQKGKPEYHGSKIVLNLNMDHPLLIGNHSIPRKVWWGGACDEFYSKAFVGLFLSRYTGGATGIMEMGMRGRKVITNVLSLPNCIPWKNQKEVEAIIEKETECIGIQDTYLANEVYSSLAKGKDLEYFNLERMSVRKE